MFDATYHLSTSAKTPKPVTEHSRLLPVVVPWDKKKHIAVPRGAVSNLKTHGESLEEKVVGFNCWHKNWVQSSNPKKSLKNIQ